MCKLPFSRKHALTQVCRVSGITYAWRPGLLEASSALRFGSRLAMSSFEGNLAMRTLTALLKNGLPSLSRMSVGSLSDFQADKFLSFSLGSTRPTGQMSVAPSMHGGGIPANLLTGTFDSPVSCSEET